MQGVGQDKKLRPDKEDFKASHKTQKRLHYKIQLKSSSK